MANVYGKNKPQYQSDVIVDLLQEYELPFVALHPGASFRGLHDSLINYGGNMPEMLLCLFSVTSPQRGVTLVRQGLTLLGIGFRFADGCDLATRARASSLGDDFGAIPDG